MPVNLEEIAKLAGASRSTVSRVINNSPNVSEQTRQRIQQVIQELNYQPNRAARILAGGSTKILGLVIPMGVARLFSDPYFPLLIQGVSSACNTFDYTVMLWLAEPEYERRMINQILHNGLIDGVIISSALLNDPLVETLGKSGLPFIMVGRHPSTETVSYVDIDNVDSARQAVAYLLRQGRRKIATITGALNMIAGIDRQEGYINALRERGLSADPDLMVSGDFSEAGGYEAAGRLLFHKPDAIFAASDQMAIGAFRAIREAGLSIPKDIAVVGFDDIPAAAHTDPPLTTIRQPIIRHGFIVTQTLIEMIENPSEKQRRILLPTELVIRSSG